MQKTQSKKPAFTPSEKLIVDMAATAMSDLHEALNHMRRQKWHESEDRHLRTIEHDVRHILYKTGPLEDRFADVLAAPETSEITRLPAWNGYPDADPDQINKEDAQ